jgi:hypothetical protein
MLGTTTGIVVFVAVIVLAADRLSDAEDTRVSDVQTGTVTTKVPAQWVTCWVRRCSAGCLTRLAKGGQDRKR